MLPARPAYYNFFARMRALLLQSEGGVSKPQLHNLCLLAYGLFAAANAQLTRVAARLPFAGGVSAGLQRLERLLRNGRVRPAAS